MNIYCSSDGSYRDILYDKVFVRRFFKNINGWTSFLLWKKMRSHRDTIPVAVLVNMIASDTDDDYEYAQAKWMFVPNPLFALPHFTLVVFFSYIASIHTEERVFLLAFIVLDICITILFATLMIKEFTNSIREGFCSPSGDQIVRCGFWRTLAIWFLVLLCLPRRASAMMSKARASSNSDYGLGHD